MRGTAPRNPPQIQNGSSNGFDDRLARVPIPGERRYPVRQKPRRSSEPVELVALELGEAVGFVVSAQGRHDIGQVAVHEPRQIVPRQ